MADDENNKPRYDEEALNRFAEVGRRAWADVPDAAQWVRQLRGWEPDEVARLDDPEPSRDAENDQG